MTEPVGECPRCSKGFEEPRPSRRRKTKRVRYCAPCSATIDGAIRRYVGGDRDLTHAELAAELGLTRTAVRQRVAAVRKPNTRAERTARLRAELFAILGDRRCVYCEGTEAEVGPLEPHHVDGCTWRQSSLNAEARAYRYLRELREGVRLVAACRTCNAEIGKPTPREPEEVACPF